MAGFKQPEFIERQEAAAKARKLALEKFRAKIADPALAKRLRARAARAAERSGIKNVLFERQPACRRQALHP